MQPEININKSGRSIPVYERNGEYDGNYGNQIGTIYNNELFILVGYNDALFIEFYSPTGYRWGCIRTQDVYNSLTTPAYQGQYSYGWLRDSGYQFKVLHRQSRIFDDENQITAVQPGGYIYTDGQSEGGSSHPYRLSINGYQHEGSDTVHLLTNGWCDVDIEIGYTMYNTVTIDGNWV
ncbi:hypothetical protein [Gracilibacillus sp. YIM 98692]|uniref:hypothetical protein n=1 Tax=Gracilibacillus sp. YIM 98692 TaxID=2663532 RepID=UPI0013D4A19F|nr:hypothetical protein [Gracilibacillus sp. YIM 98692]